MNLIVPYIAVTAVALASQFLDWDNTEKNILKSGLASEKNPIVKFLYGLSPYAALAYKFLPPAILFLVPVFHWHDIQYFDVKYLNASGVDKWAITWLSTEAGDALAGLVGYFTSNKLVKL